jgi:hypothetical protein
MKILIEENDKNFLTEAGLREFIANLRTLLVDSRFKRQSVDIDLFNNTLIKFAPDVVDMQQVEEDFEKKWLIREAKTPWEEVNEEFVEND